MSEKYKEAKASLAKLLGEVEQAVAKLHVEPGAKNNVLDKIKHAISLIESCKYEQMDEAVSDVHAAYEFVPAGGPDDSFRDKAILARTFIILTMIKYRHEQAPRKPTISYDKPSGELTVNDGNGTVFTTKCDPKNADAEKFVTGLIERFNECNYPALQDIENLNKWFSPALGA